RLLWRDAKGQDGSVELASDPVYVGRAADCAIRTDDGMVSRRHSVVKRDGGQYWVEDLQSANGIEVNSIKVQKQALKHNDTVRCGSLWLRFVIDGSEEPSLAAPTTLPPPPVELVRLREELADQRDRADQRQAERDQEIAENKRLRAENQNLQRM